MIKEKTTDIYQLITTNELNRIHHVDNAQPSKGVALGGSSSWSHSFVCCKFHYEAAFFYKPDHDSCRTLITGLQQQFECRSAITVHGYSVPFKPCFHRLATGSIIIR